MRGAAIGRHLNSLSPGLGIGSEGRDAIRGVQYGTDIIQQTRVKSDGRSFKHKGAGHESYIRF